MSDKAVLVIGAGGFLGSNLCTFLAKSEYSVISIDRCFDRLANSNEKFIKCNISDVSCLIRTLQTLLAETESAVVGLVYLAASKPDGFFQNDFDYFESTWDEIFQVNVKAMFFACRELGRFWIENSIKGSIVNFSSIYGIVGPNQRMYEDSYNARFASNISTPCAYSASKGAVISLTRHLAASFGSHCIRCNILTPGGVAELQNTEFEERYGESVPLGRMARASEISRAVLFLLDGESSSYVTGHNLIVDGGFTAW